MSLLLPQAEVSLKKACNQANPFSCFKSYPPLCKISPFSFFLSSSFPSLSVLSNFALMLLLFIITIIT
ncbi:hypothetical protein RJT34_02655 [Clitoria ternatea]|uniref:Uncharacterized protein n=1 Tax=Clitoria ternatea TaxID=43366 RepID=A0AAN9KKN2_CLITE